MGCGVKRFGFFSSFRQTSFFSKRQNTVLLLQTNPRPPRFFMLSLCFPFYLFSSSGLATRRRRRRRRWSSSGIRFLPSLWSSRRFCRCRCRCRCRCLPRGPRVPRGSPRELRRERAGESPRWRGRRRRGRNRSSFLSFLRRRRRRPRRSRAGARRRRRRRRGFSSFSFLLLDRRAQRPHFFSGVPL